MATAGVVALAAGSSLISGSVRPAAAAAAQSVQAEPASQLLSPSVAQQMEALAAEKMSRTPTQKKIDSQLIYALKMARGQSIASGVQSLSLNVTEGEQGRVVVDISATISDSLIAQMEAGGAKILAATPDLNSLRAEVYLDQLETLADLSGVRFIQPKQQAMTHRKGEVAGRSGEATANKAAPGKGQLTAGSFAVRAARVRSQLTQALAKQKDAGLEATPGAQVEVGRATSEGDAAHRANTARGTFNTDGTGVKIGVLSDGVVNVAAAKASGDVPQNLIILPGQAGEGDEGTAMLEIVHDLAPGAQLYFAGAFISVTSFADNIRALRSAGCDIIVDDIFYFAETPFQDGQAPGVVSNTNGGAIMQAVNDVTAAGALYFSSAGNEGNKNDNTSGVWEGDFTPGGTNATIGGAGSGIVHDFDPGAAVAQSNQITAFGGVNAVSLFWAEPLGGATSDYDLYVLNSAGTTIVGASTNGQSGTQDPVELAGGNAVNNRVVVALFSGVPRFLHVNSIRSRLQFNTPGQTKGHSSAAEAYSVAATPARTPFGNPPNPVGPFPAPFNSTNKVELFSADGPRRIFFTPAGAPYTPGNTTSTGGIVRQKPDITAADGVDVTGAGGFADPFFGTSAAAPHAAAIAALVKSARPTLTPAQIRTALTSSAIDIEAPGVDRDSGAGIVMAYEALQAAGATGTANLQLGTVTATEVAAGSNGNTFVEPGESGSLTIQLTNTGVNAATGITATLTSNTPGVAVTQGTSAYPDIPATNGSATNTTPFTFAISSTAACPSTISFTLTVTYTGGPSPKQLTFSLTVSQSVTANTTLDAVPPPNGPVYTATTGLQTGRLVRVGTPTSCGTIKSNPGINAADAAVPHRYDAYTFQNNTASNICVTVTLTTANTAAAVAALQSVAYAPNFVPAQLDQNYIGDIGGNTVASRSYSFDVPANTSFVVVVNEITGGGGGGTAYTLKVDGLPCSPATAVNQPPVNTVPGPQNINMNAPLVFSAANGNAITVADPDAGNAPLKVTLTAANGTLTLASTAGLTFIVGDGFADTDLTFTGSAASINAALNGLSFTPTPNFMGLASLNILTDDQGFLGSGGAKSDVDTVLIGVAIPGGTLQFSASSYSVNENAGTATITVTRTVNTFGNLTVNYSTSDNTALAGQDYGNTAGTLNFASGVTSLTFDVPIIDDAILEGVESLNLILSDPTGGGTLGPRATALLFIQDNEAPPPPDVFGVTMGNSLVRFNSVTPGSIAAPIAITGLQPGETILGIDFRPATGQLYGLGSTSRVYVIDTATGIATAAGAPFTPALAGTDFGVDFNPAVDRIRVVSDADQNLRLNPATGAVAGNDTALAYASGDPNFGSNPNVTGAAYTNNFAGTASTTIYGIDTNLDVLVRQGSAGGSPTSPNSGQLFTVGSLGVNSTGFAGFDIRASSNTGYAALTGPGDTVSRFYTVNLSTGAATLVGDIGGVNLIRGIALAPAGTFQLSAAAATVSEGAGRFNLTVTRTGNTTGPASVTYSTVDGTATQKGDYIIRISTLNFAPGETSKSFDVFVIDDTFVEGSESLTVALGSATGDFTPGGSSPITLTITDNDAVPSANPIDTTSFFVRQHYLDFLNREPEPGEPWSAILNGCPNRFNTNPASPSAQCDRILVSSSFFRSPEFQTRGAFVIDYYLTAFGRNPTYLEFVADMTRIGGASAAEADANRTAFTNEFVARPEFTAIYAALSNQAYVDKIETTAGVTLTNKAQLVASLDNNSQTRAQVLRTVVESQQIRNRFYNTAFVLSEYFGYLRRDPDAGGFNAWLNFLNTNPNDFRTMVNGFVNSSEYRARFGQ